MSIISALSERFSLRRQPKSTVTSIYDFKIAAIDGKEIDFSVYRGKKLLIVNTASKCGFTYQYDGLQKLHEQYGDKVTILGFPANDFLWQEPGNDNAIAEFCRLNFGVTFQMFNKVTVRGRHAHPLFQWLYFRTGRRPSWNFCKYLIGADGSTINFYSSKVEPTNGQLLEAILS